MKKVPCSQREAKKKGMSLYAAKMILMYSLQAFEIQLRFARLRQSKHCAPEQYLLKYSFGFGVKEEEESGHENNHDNNRVTISQKTKNHFPET